MANPYIQNFINSRQQEANAPVAQGGKKEGILNTNVKPETPKGYIVKENALQSAGSSVTGLAKTGVYFVNAVNGKGTDYTVGRVNDGARFLGSLGIAAALASTAKNPKAKMMEFIGFATWFASMSLWPKMLGTAIKATKGVDVNQQYVDSYGRRKGFFEDAQYITWDLYKDKDLYKMGDKLGVPQNIENRKDAIKEKAKQVATQGNTLMMLTAGFATPIATALICNTLENPVSKAIERYQLSKAEKALEKLSETELMSGSEKGLEQLRKIMGTGKTAQFNVNEARQLRSLFNGVFGGTGIGDGVSREVKELVGTSKLVVKADATIAKALHGSLSLGDDALKALVGGSSEHFEAVKKAIQSIDRKQFNGLLETAGELNREGRIGLKQLVKTSLGEQLLSVEGLQKETRNKIYSTVQKQLQKELKKHSKIEVAGEKLQNLFKAAHDFVARKNIADQYAKATIANVADSQTANNWDKAPREILKALGIDKKTRKLIASDPIKAPEYIQQHLENLAKDSNKLNQVAEKIAKIAEKVIGRETNAAEKLAASLSQIEAASGKQAKGFKYLETAVKEAVAHEKTSVQNKVMNTKSSFYRPLLILDKIKDAKTSKEVLKELISGFGIDFWSNKGEHRGIKNAEKFGQFIDEALSPLKNILGGNKGLRAKINEFHQQIKAPLSQIDGATRNFIGNATTNRSDWAVRVGKSFNDFIRDAATAQGIKNTWLKRVLFVAVPVVSVSLLAISQFGKKNNYNSDVYVEKGNN